MSAASAMYVPRRCTEVGTDESEPKPLCAYRDRSAYVLLGAPGAGKTRAFEHEAARTGGEYVTARDFLTFDDRPEWHDRVLYVDGLDERRAGSPDKRTALDDIRARIHALGSPSFRLSCREGDWFGAPDRAALASVSRDRTLAELRLHPLTDADVGELLDHFGVDDARGFVAQCRALGIEGMARNPQTLAMLGRSAADGQWPASRTEVFERSCLALAREQNPEHRQAAMSPLSDAELLSAAGRLSAVLLITGAKGYAEAGEMAPDLLALSTFLHADTPTQSVLAATVRTSLFEVHDGVRTPSHRHVAEFLGGRYLADLVANGLPAGRVLALLTGFDGGVVSELRGLAAWFAAHSLRGRRRVVQLDPVGVVLYGDVRSFSPGEKQRLIHALEGVAAKDPWSLTAYHEMDARWADLATEDMREHFEAALARRDATEAQEAMLIALLESLARGSRVPGMATPLMDAVRDGERPLGVRELSLGAFMNQADDVEAVLALAGDIRARKVSDPRGYLLGKLLLRLYPADMQPATLASYLVLLDDSGGGWLTHFWLRHVPHASTPEQLEELMDALVATGTLKAAARPGEGAHYLLRKVPGRYLWTLLKEGRTDARRLFQWMAFVDPWSYVDHAAEIRNWFAEHPETFYEVFRISMAEEADPDALDSVGRRLIVRIGPPTDFGIWCVDQANTQSSARLAARYLAKAAAHIGDKPDWNAIALRLDRQPERLDELRERWEAHRASLAPADVSHERRADQQRRQAWHDAVLQQSQALDENRANPRLLHDLASVYFGLVGSDVTGADPRARLPDLLLGDKALVERVIRAFVMVRDREDLPTEKEVMRLAAQGRRHYLSLPFLAGLEEHSWGSDEDVLRMGLAVLFNDVVLEEDPGWHASAVATRPELVAEVLTKSVRRALRTGADGVAALYRLREPGYARVADSAILGVLRSFPTRAAGKWLPSLATLLCVGLVRRGEEMPALIRVKSSTKSMDLGQRMYWLCAGLLSGEHDFVPAMRSALNTGGERRARHVAGFFRLAEQDSPRFALRPEALELLIRSVGGSYRPIQRKRGRTDTVTMDMEGADLVRRWIDQLGGNATAPATDSLRDLIAMPTLSAWRRSLRNAAAAQREARRNASFQHPEIEQVLETLDRGRPANAADLAALTVDALGDLAQTIRHGPTSDWKQYWTTGMDAPEHEEVCRDRLLSDLNHGPFLLCGVQAEPEGRYANAKRADIKVIGGEAALPIEVKKSNHRELWTAMRSQLMAKYAGDAQAQGYGVYLVLWYGESHCQPDGEGYRAQDAADLRRRLLATLDEVELRKISVCVLDVSRP